MRELTIKEKLVMKYAATGKSNGEIATVLEVSKSTVENHIHSIFIKLNVRNRVEAINKYRKDI